MKYQRLTQRDIIQPNDQYKTNWGTWTEIEPEHIGKRKGSVMSHYVIMRRLKLDPNVVGKENNESKK